MVHRATKEEMARGYNLPPLHVRSLKEATRRNRMKHGKTRAIIESQSDVDSGIFNKQQRMLKNIGERVIKGTR